MVNLFPSYAPSSGGIGIIDENSPIHMSSIKNNIDTRT